jgi:hypothetical protein
MRPLSPGHKVRITQGNNTGEEGTLICGRWPTPHPDIEGHITYVISLTTSLIITTPHAEIINP